jgi:hypothetical protein
MVEGVTRMDGLWEGKRRSYERMLGGGRWVEWVGLEQYWCDDWKLASRSKYQIADFNLGHLDLNIADSPALSHSVCARSSSVQTQS